VYTEEEPPSSSPSLSHQRRRQNQNCIYSTPSMECLKLNQKKDSHQKGDFEDTSFSAVKARVGRDDIVRFHQGFIPETFTGLEESKISFAHVDVDIYRSVLDCCEFIMQRLTPGGFVVFDDYGFPSCPGAKEAVDEFFGERQEKPLVLPTGQAVIFNSF